MTRILLTLGHVLLTLSVHAWPERLRSQMALVSKVRNRASTARESGPTTLHFATSDAMSVL